MNGTRPNPGKRRRIDLNRASRQELMRIPGIGPMMADQLMRHRMMESRKPERKQKEEPEREQKGEPERPVQHVAHGHMSEREFDELLDKLYI